MLHNCLIPCNAHTSLEANRFVLVYGKLKCIFWPNRGWSRSQLFKDFFLLRTFQHIDWISLGANHLKCITRWEGTDGDTITIFFPACKWWTQDQLSIGRHPRKDLKWTELGLGPIQTRLEGFLGFLVKTKMKVYTKLTVVMCYQIVSRKSVAPSSGDFRWRSAPFISGFRPNSIEHQAPTGRPHCLLRPYSCVHHSNRKNSFFQQNCCNS